MSKTALMLLLLCSISIVIESKAAEKPEVEEASTKTSPETSAPPRWLGFNTWAPSTETLRRFSEAGVNTVCCFPANVLSSVGEPYNSAYPPIWNGPGNYDFECLDRQVSDKLAVNPKAKFIFYLDLNTPTWWCRIRGDRNPDSFDELGRVAASDVWRRDTREYLQAVLRHLESKHKDVIIGYFLACGHTIEWLDHSRGEEGDYRCKAWRRWMIERGRPDPVDIPPKSVRDHVSHGPFRDPVIDGLAVDYWQFTSELVGDTILYYAVAVQEVIKHRVPLGLCYGYIMELQGHRLLYGGHLDFDRVYASKDLDWFVSPGTYYDRQIGGGSGFMVPIGSVQHHNKGFLMSMDHRTPTSRRMTKFGKKIPGHEATFSDEAACIAGLRREFSLRLISGISTYWLDLFGKWFEGDALFESIAQMREIWEQQARPREKSVAEVAVFADAKSMYYLDGGAKIHNSLLYKQRYGLHRMGTPYDLYSFGDLETLDLSRYKLIFFPNLFVVDAKRRALLKEKVCTDGKTVLWGYSPGIIADGKYDPSQVEALTGIPWEAKELTSRDMDGWRSVYSPQPNVPADVLRRLAREAGAHIYCEAEEPLYANDRLIALHTIEGGPRTVVLPKKCRRVTELFSGRVVAEDADRFVDTLTRPCTVLYQVEE